MICQSHGRPEKGKDIAKRRNWKTKLLPGPLVCRPLVGFARKTRTGLQELPTIERSTVKGDLRSIRKAQATERERFQQEKQIVNKCTRDPRRAKEARACRVCFEAVASILNRLPGPLLYLPRNDLETLVLSACHEKKERECFKFVSEATPEANRKSSQGRSSSAISCWPRAATPRNKPKTS